MMKTQTLRCDLGKILFLLFFLLFTRALAHDGLDKSKRKRRGPSRGGGEEEEGDHGKWESIHGDEFELPPDMVAAVIARRERRRLEREGIDTNHTLSEADVLEDLFAAAAASKIIEEHNENVKGGMNITDIQYTIPVKRSPEEIREILENFGFSSYDDLDEYLDELYEDYLYGDEGDEYREDDLLGYYDNYYYGDHYLL